MLAYPTPTFDAKTILAAPGYRPIGKSGMTVPSNEPVAETPLNLVNRHTANGGYVGSRAKHFIQNNQFLNEKYDYAKGTPLSKPGSVGNVGDQFIAAGRPFMAEPANEELRVIMSILNGKPVAEERQGRLTAKQVKAMGARSKKMTGKSERKDGTSALVSEISDTQKVMNKQRQIKNAMAQGFSKAEAEEAYEKVRVKQAEVALKKDADVSMRLYNVIDSKVSGNVSGNVPGNDESALYLAKAQNVVQTKKAVELNMAKDRSMRVLPEEMRSRL